MQKKSFSWGTIAVLFIFCLPVAVWMIIKKVTTEKLNYTKNGNALRVVGWLLFFMGVFYLLAGLRGFYKTADGSNRLDAMVMMLVVCFGGAALTLRQAKAYIGKGIRYSKYLSVINGSQDTRLGTIAAAYGTTSEQAARDIQEMLDDGYFMGGRIDEQRGELFIPVHTLPENKTPPPKRVTRVVTCRCCGGINHVVQGEVAQCDYCDSPL